jgi:protein-L-isoaspartate(D-aspartate) O-methyltransferase
VARDDAVHRRQGTSRRGGGVRALVLVACTALAACKHHDATSGAAPSPAPGDTPAAARSPSGADRTPSDGDERRAERSQMVETQIAAEGVSDSRTLAAMRRVPRHRFVAPGFEARAYEDRPLPIPGGQTISQPYIVAFMTEAADIAPGERCLEIGTGSGYQAAVLAELCGATYSIEYLPEVAAFGRKNLQASGYATRVELRVGDGYGGWPEHAPFDAILVTAAPEKVPAPLLAQLAPAGKLVIPVGPEGGRQKLERWTRVGPGQGESAFERETLLGVAFVPFLGDAAR